MSAGDNEDDYPKPFSAVGTIGHPRKGRVGDEGYVSCSVPVDLVIEECLARFARFAVYWLPFQIKRTWLGTVSS
jgi:hypothetical protein